MAFKTPDGKSFESRAEWRDYMVLNFYSFKDKHNEPEPLIKAPGSIDGQSFDIANCTNSTLCVLDYTEQIQIDNLENCRVFIGACTSSLFIRNCKNCVFYTACRQLRLREVTDTIFFSYSMSEIHIEYSNKLQFAPLNGGYKEQEKHFKAARLNVDHNLWYDIYDHNDAAKTHENWSLLPEDQYGEPWFPLGVCEPYVPMTKPGAVSRKTNEGSASENEMSSFSLQQMINDANKLNVSAPAPAPAAAASNPPPLPPLAEKPVAAAATATAPATAPAATPAANDEEAIKQVVTSFVGLKVGTNLEGVVSPLFSLLLPNGITVTRYDLEVSAPLASAQIKTVRFQVVSGDMAYGVYEIVDADGTQSVYTIVLQKTGNWIISHAHASIVEV